MNMIGRLVDELQVVVRQRDAFAEANAKLTLQIGELQETLEESYEDYDELAFELASMENGSDDEPTIDDVNDLLQYAQEELSAQIVVPVQATVDSAIARVLERLDSDVASHLDTHDLLRLAEFKRIWKDIQKG